DKQIVARFRADQARAEELPGGSAVQKFFAAAAEKAVDSNLPKHERARQHIAIFKHLMDEIGKANNSERPNLVFLMKGHVDKAIELDPLFDEAQFALAMWYLQFPELAAKNLEK